MPSHRVIFCFMAAGSRRRKSYGAGGLPRWKWQGRARMRWKSWQRDTAYGSQNFSATGLPNSRNEWCSVGNCTRPCFQSTGKCWEHRTLDHNQPVAREKAAKEQARLQAERKRAEEERAAREQAIREAEFQERQRQQERQVIRKDLGNQGQPSGTVTGVGTQQDRSKFLEGRLSVSAASISDGSCEFSLVEQDTLVAKLSPSTDQKMMAAIENLLKRGNPLAARLSWASRKGSNGRWEPLLVVGLGDPKPMRPTVALFLISISNWWSSPEARQYIAGQLATVRPVGASMKANELYAMPSVLLWDGTRGPSGGLVGSTYQRSLVAAFALRPIEDDLLTGQKVGMPVQSKSMATDPVGTIRITKFEPNFFRAAGGGFMGA